MVLREHVASGTLTALVARYGARLVDLPADAPIPGSYWGAPEAGLAGDGVFVRPDTPVHSLLHELSHYVCMTPTRRAGLQIDAGGDDDEECAVCYLQVVLAEHVPGFGVDRCLEDMDTWGYTFREGSARAWRDGDAAAARAWLEREALLDAHARPTWQLRGVAPRAAVASTSARPASTAQTPRASSDWARRRRRAGGRTPSRSR